MTDKKLTANEMLNSMKNCTFEKCETFIAIPDLAERLEVESNLRAELRQQVHDLAGENQRLKTEADGLRDAYKILHDYTDTLDYLNLLARVHGYDLVKRPEVESKGEAIAKAMKHDQGSV